MKDSKRIFLTGSASFIGREIRRQCADNGIFVTGIDMVSSDDATCHEADIRDPSIADLIPEDTDAIIHLAALSRDPDCKDRGYECFDANVMGTFNLMNAAQAKGVKQFIFASTEWVYTGFEDGLDKTEDSAIDIQALTSEYALSKLVVESNLRQKFSHGFCSVTILRLGIIYGPRANNWSAVEALLNTVATKDDISVGALETARRFIHVGDVARAFRQSIGLDGLNIINIQGAELVSLGDVIETSKQLLNKQTVVTEKDAASPSIRRVSADKAKKMIDFSAEIPLNQGLQDVIDFLGL